MRGDRLTVTLCPLFARPIEAAMPTMPAPTIKISKLGIVWADWYDNFVAGV